MQYLCSVVLTELHRIIQRAYEQLIFYANVGSERITNVLARSTCEPNVVFQKTNFRFLFDFL